MNKEFHFIYKITNTVNGMYYYGLHSTNNLEDGYMGSGRLLQKAIKQFGAKKFSREIISMCETRECAFIKEAEIVDSIVIDDDLCYNLVEGGNRMRTNSKKRRFFTFRSRVEKEIFTKDAENLTISADLRYDSEFEYIFGINQVEVASYKAHLSSITFKDKFQDKFYKEISMFLINNIAQTLTLTYNNKMTNNQAVILLTRLKSKGLVSLINAQQVRWADTYGQTSKMG